MSVFAETGEGTNGDMRGFAGRGVVGETFFQKFLKTP
jgi:hypothetical protein